MGIQIWLPIVINALILCGIVASIFIGKKNGFIYELIKLILVGGSAVGLFFLNPILSQLVLKIKAVEQLLAQGLLTAEIVNGATIVIAFLVSYLLITLGMKVVLKIQSKLRIRKLHKNDVKRIKPVGLTVKDTKRLRAEQKKDIKEQHKQDKLAVKKAHKTLSKVFGAIIGVIIVLVVGFFVTLPLKPLAKEISTIKPELQEVVKGYEYTPYGQLDKLTSIVEIIIK